MAIQINTQSRNSEGQSDRKFPVSPFRLFEDFFNDWAVRSLQPETRSNTWIPPVDVLKKDGSLLIRQIDGKSVKIIVGDVLLR